MLHEFRYKYRSDRSVAQKRYLDLLWCVLWDMARCSLCVVLLFSTFATTLALDYIKCTKWDRQCSQECGTNTCIVKEKCCYFRGKCFYRNRTERTCGPFKCLNGGTRVPLVSTLYLSLLYWNEWRWLCLQLGKRDTSAVAYGCEVPLPVCSCKAGFSGRCCQSVYLGKCLSIADHWSPYVYRWSMCTGEMWLWYSVQDSASHM